MSNPERALRLIGMDGRARFVVFDTVKRFREADIPGMGFVDFHDPKRQPLLVHATAIEMADFYIVTE
jgi:hypothetical protein